MTLKGLPSTYNKDLQVRGRAVGEGPTRTHTAHFSGPWRTQAGAPQNCHHPCYAPSP